MTTTPYNSGLHKGRNLSVFLAGWGAWVAILPPAVLTAYFDTLAVPLDNVTFGLGYLALGSLCYGLIRDRAPRLGLSLMTGAYLSIVSFFFVSNWQAASAAGTWLTAWSTEIFTHAGLGVIGLTAISDFVKGEPHV